MHPTTQKYEFSEVPSRQESDDGEEAEKYATEAAGPLDAFGGSR